METWRENVREAVEALADEELQRRSWLGNGPEVYDPIEAFEQFFTDADAEGFFKRSDNGLSLPLSKAFAALLVEMEQLEKIGATSWHPQKLVDDVRWIAVRRKAASVFQLLAEERKQ